MVRVSDKLRLRAMEREITDCWVDRYYGDLLGFYAENPDVNKMHEEMFTYLESRCVDEIPTYFHYWEDEDYRRRLWIIERDTIARGMLDRIERTSKDIIDGKAARLKHVGDGSHLPVLEQPGDEAKGAAC